MRWEGYQTPLHMTTGGMNPPLLDQGSRMLCLNHMAMCSIHAYAHCVSQRETQYTNVCLRTLQLYKSNIVQIYLNIPINQ